MCLMIVCKKGHLSPEQKRAVIYPGLKKPSLNIDDLANYRPISDLSFVSKLLERAVHAQLLMYLNENELLPSVQSAYRQFFSTETAVLEVVSDVLTAMDQSCPRVGWTRGSGRVGSGRVTILPDFGGSGRVGSALRIFLFFY